jgi:hypothetical protein
VLVEQEQLAERPTKVLAELELMEPVPTTMLVMPLAIVVRELDSLFDCIR